MSGPPNTLLAADDVHRVYRLPRTSCSGHAPSATPSSGVSLDVGDGRHARHRRRVGLGQVDAGAHPPRSRPGHAGHASTYRRPPRRARPPARAALVPPRRADRLPGPAQLARPADDASPTSSPSRSSASTSPAPTSTASPRCCRRSASTRPPATATPTSSRAASSSASPSPAPSPRTRRCSSPTSR